MIERDLAAGEDVDLERHIQLLDLQRQMRLRVTGLRKRADDAREAQRLAIALLATRIGKLAAVAQQAAELTQALADLAEAAQRARDLAADQDHLLGELQAGARALGVGLRRRPACHRPGTATWPSPTTGSCAARWLCEGSAPPPRKPSASQSAI